MAQYLIDTSSVSDYLSASLSVTGTLFMDAVIDAIPNIFVITQIELLCWKTDAATEQKVSDFIGDSILLDITPAVIAQCVALRKGRKIKTPDAIIAATALAYGYTLITGNEKDFAHISGLNIINPAKL
jgi:predicted nucleic acid-binding protein